MKNGTERLLGLFVAMMVALGLFFGPDLLSSGLPFRARAAQAAGLIYCVGPGSGASGCANPNNQDFSDIAQALGLAGDGDEIRVAIGTYAAITVGRSVTISGGYPGGPDGYCCGLADPNGTLISGAGGPAITVVGGAPTLRHIVESDGVEVSGGALTVANDGTSQGNFDISAGSTVTFTNGPRFWADGLTITGAGFGYISGDSVTVSGTVSAQNLAVDGTLNLAGTLNATGTLSWISGAMNGPGTLNIPPAATLTMSGPATKLERGSTTNNSGTAVVLASPGFYQSDDAVFNNLAGALFDNQADAGVGLFPFESGGRTFNNFGTFRKSGGSGSTRVDDSFNNSGTVDAQSGDILFDDGLTGSGAFTIAAGATATFANTADTLNDGATISGAGYAVVANANVTLNGAVNAQNLAVQFGTLLGPGTLTVTNVLSWTQGSLNGPGSINIPSGATLQIDGPGAKFQRLGTINNAGTTVVTGAYGFGQSGGAVFNNLAGGLFDLQSNVGVGSFIFESGGRNFNNAGILRKSAGTGTSSVDDFFTNTGTVQAQVGNLLFDGGLASSSGISIASGANVTFANSTVALNAGASITGAGLATIGNATLDANDSVSVDNLLLTPGGTLGGPGSLNVTQSFNWTGGNISDAGALNILSGASMTISGPDSKFLRARTLNNAGTIAVQSGYGYGASQGAVVNNQAGGLFDVQADVGLGFFIFESGGRTFNNAGTFQKSAGSGAASMGMDFTNSGTVNALSGELNFSAAFTQNGGAINLNGGNLSTNNPLNLLGGTLAGSGTLTGSVMNSAQVSPGFSPGRLTINGNYTQGPSGVLNLQIAGLAPGTQFDQLNVTGQAALDGTLNVTLLNGYAPNPADSFQVLPYGSRSGSFATVNLPDLGSGNSMVATYNPTDLTLAVAGPTPTNTPTPAFTATPTMTPTPSTTPTRTPKITRTPAPSPTPSQTPKATRTPTATRTQGSTPTSTRTPKLTRTPTATPTGGGVTFAGGSDAGDPTEMGDMDVLHAE